jgi:hypothetical protein
MLQLRPETVLQERFLQTGKSLDGIAIAVSLACVLHCLLLPLLIILFPILGSALLADESFHALLLVLIIPTSAVALYLGCREHGEGLVIWLGVLGLAILGLAAMLGIEGLGILGEKALTGVGGTLLATALVMNFRRCRARRCEEQAACATADAVA